MSGARTFRADAQRQFNNLSAGYQPGPSFLAKEMLLNRRDQAMGSRRSPAGKALDGGIGADQVPGSLESRVAAEFRLFLP